MFTLAYKPLKIINPTKIIVTDAIDPTAEKIAEGYKEINGEYLHIGSIPYREYSQEAFSETFNWSVINFKSISQWINDLYFYDDNTKIVKAVYINDVIRPDLYGDNPNEIWWLKANVNDGADNIYNFIYINDSNNINNPAGIYQKNNMIVIYDIYSSLSEQIIEENVELNFTTEATKYNSYYLETYGKTFDQLPNNITITAIQ